jgi:hypothetical protein
MEKILSLGNDDDDEATTTPPPILERANDLLATQTPPPPQTQQHEHSQQVFNEDDDDDDDDGEEEEDDLKKLSLIGVANFNKIGSKLAANNRKKPLNLPIDDDDYVKAILDEMINKISNDFNEQ